MWVFAPVPFPTSGFLVGWRVRKDVVFIATSVTSENLLGLTTFLASTNKIPQWDSLNSICGPPIVIGQIVAKQRSPHSSLSKFPLWIDFYPDPHKPSISNVYLNGACILPQAIQIFLFTPTKPQRFQILSLTPLDLDISYEPKTQAPIPSENSCHRHRVSCNFNKILDEKVTSVTEKPSPINLELCMNQVNSTLALKELLQLAHFTIKEQRLESQKKRLFSFIALSKTLDFLMQKLQPCFLTSLLFLLYIIQLFSDAILSVLEFPITLPFIHSDTSFTIKGISAAAQQLDLRMQQISYWPSQYIYLRTKGRRQFGAIQAQYIGFHNSVWLVANDILLGISLGSFISSNADIISTYFIQLHNNYAILSLRSMVIWLMGYPAGLKLNSELGKILGEMFLWLIQIWTVFLSQLRPYFPYIISCIGACGILGTSMVAALMFDVFTLINLHVRGFHHIAARLYKVSLSTLSTLFYLFQGDPFTGSILCLCSTILIGKKHNILRKRIDQCNYDIDQLLLGTILFTLFAFLFPTVLVYHVLFTVAWIVVIFVQLILELLMTLQNHFPLFAIMLRIKDPDRLPGGIQFEVVGDEWFERIRNGGLFWWFRKALSKKTDKKDVQQKNPFEAVYIRVKNLPIPFSSIFFQYRILLSEIMKHYEYMSAFKRVCIGLPLESFPILQYSMLPTSRPLFETILQDIQEHPEQACK